MESTAAAVAGARIIHRILCPQQTPLAKIKQMMGMYILYVHFDYVIGHHVAIMYCTGATDATKVSKAYNYYPIL